MLSSARASPSALARHMRVPARSLARVKVRQVAHGKVRRPASTANLMQDTVSSDLLDRVDTFVLDCDGVLWEGATPIDQSIDALRELERLGKRLFFVTNNSAKSRSAYVEKFATLGFEAKQEQIITSAFVAAQHAASLNLNGSVYVVGGDGIRDELQQAGVEVAQEPPGGLEPACTAEEFVNDLVPDSNIKAVIVGCDSSFTYRKICYASRCIQAGAVFISTNLDAGDMHGGVLMPGAGACVGAICSALGRDEPDVNCGKPSSIMLSVIRDSRGVDLSRAAVVGDRLDTDIMLGVTGDAAVTVLTLSGVATAEDVAQAAADGGVVPTTVVPRLSALVF